MEPLLIEKYTSAVIVPIRKYVQGLVNSLRRGKGCKLRGLTLQVDNFITQTGISL